MKRKFNQLILWCFVMIIAACSPDENLEPAFLETMEKVELQKEESLSRTLPTFSNQQTNSRSASANYGTLDLDKIYKRIASEDQLYPNYMIRLYPPKGIENSLEYLVMIGTEYGFRAYILQYQTNPDHINTITDPTIYTGFINILDLQRNFLARNYFTNGIESELPESNNNRATEPDCDCEYEFDLVVHNDLSATVIITEIHCVCNQSEEEGLPNDESGGEGGDIGDPIIDPEYGINLPDGENSSGGSSGDGSTSDPIGTEKEVLCLNGYIKNSDNKCVLEEEYIVGEIQKKLDDNPYALLEIDCNQITEWQDLAQNEASSDIKNKINALQSQNTDWDDDWAIQSLNGAEGTIVNMDYFSVNVSNLPNNPSTGNQFTPEGFLDYFRRNINEFADKSMLGSTFKPYCEISSICEQETNLWNSSDPTGALVYINIPGDDGVVVCSEYTPSYWYFMTLEAPGAGNHPVSGTRQFGFETVPSRSGPSYNFFVRGVDRFDNNLIENTLNMATLGINPFFGADALWESVQSNLNDFINDPENGGASTIKTPVKNRTDWEKIMDVLEGRRPISDLGCN